jgi:hypothetical protein
MQRYAADNAATASKDTNDEEVIWPPEKKSELEKRDRKKKNEVDGAKLAC